MKKAFTLVELLAVIVILAIILVIAVPKIVNTIENARKGSFVSSAKLVAETVEREYAVAQTLGNSLDEFENGIDCLNATWTGLETNDYSACVAKIVNGKAEVTLVGKGKFDKYSVCSGTKLDASVASACNYSVAFNTGGGSTVSPQDIGYGKKYGELPTPTKEGYTFLGWFTEETGGTQITSETIKNTNDTETIYAHWSINEYTLTINNGSNSTITVNRTSSPIGNGSIGNLSNNETIYYNDTLTITFTASTGYIVSTHTVNNNNFTSGNSYTVTGNTTVVSSVTAIYTLTYNANGGSVSPTSKQVAYGSTYGSLPTPTMSGYNFVGWYTAASGGTQVTSSTTMGNSNTTIYAHWEAKFFATDSWSTIRSNINTNRYSVGDTKCVALNGFTTRNNNGCSNGEFAVRIANKSASYECKYIEGFSQSACGFVLEFVDIITEHNMNTEETNVGGWPASEMRAYVNNTIYNALPSDLKNIIIDTETVSGHGCANYNHATETCNSGETNFISTDKLYLLSAHEVWEDRATRNKVNIYDSANENTRQLDYYDGVTLDNCTVDSCNLNNSPIKKSNGTNSPWWLRTANCMTNNIYINVRNNGYWFNYYADGNYYGVSPAFRIG